MEFDKLTNEDKELIRTTKANQQEIKDTHLQHHVCKRQIVTAFLSGKSRIMIMKELQLSGTKMQKMMQKIRAEIIEELKSEDQADNILTRFEGLYAAALKEGNLDLCYKILKELLNMKNVNPVGKLMVQQEWNKIDEQGINNE